MVFVSCLTWREGPTRLKDRYPTPPIIEGTGPSWQAGPLSQNETLRYDWRPGFGSCRWLTRFDSAPLAPSRLAVWRHRVRRGAQRPATSQASHRRIREWRDMQFPDTTCLGLP